MTNWAQAWSAIDARRITLGMSKADLYERSGVSEATFRKMASGVPLARPDKVAAVERALGWEPGSVANILDGHEPVIAVSLPDGDGQLDGLRSQVVELAQLVTALAEQVAEQGAAIVQLRADLAQQPTAALRARS